MLGEMIAVLATSALVVFNVVWYFLRRLGLRAFFTRVADPLPLGTEFAAPR